MKPATPNNISNIVANEKKKKKPNEYDKADKISLALLL